MKTEPTPAEPRATSWFAMTLIFTTLGFALLAASALVWFGSVGSALAYLSGDHLIVDSRSKSFGTLEVGEDATLTFKLTNYSGTSITILGSQSSCSCVVASDVPRSIPPRMRVDLILKIRNRSKSGRISERVTLFTDCPGQRQFDLNVSGTVTTRPDSDRYGPSKP